uniref:Uncharacterized protein n=1 Tax=Oryza meridionalis TaxID=40149 RepID=A0A0E0F960_9ORYZ
MAQELHCKCADLILWNQNRMAANEEITLKELPPRSCAGTGLPLICKLGRNHRLRMRSLTNSWDELVGPLRHQLVNSTKRPEPMSHVVPDLEKVAMKMLVARAVRCLLMTMALTTPCLDMYQPSGRRQYQYGGRCR